MTAEPNKGDPRKAPLASLVQIQQVRLREVIASSKPPSLTEPMHFHVNIEHDASLLEKFEDAFVVVATLNTKLLGPVEPDAQVPQDLSSLTVYASVKASFEIRYKLPEGLVTESKEFENFAKVNGLFNAWPYLREFVQNVFGRMNFPLIVLPLLRVGPPPSEQPDK
jgi:hypothetical protein